jgi:hypothetical protein
MSSIVCPDPSFSSTISTVIRVPFITGLPTMIFGFISINSSIFLEYYFSWDDSIYFPSQLRRRRIVLGPGDQRRQFCRAAKSRPVRLHAAYSGIYAILALNISC